MFRKIKTIKDIVDWRMCIGCGACYSYCSKQAIKLVNFEEVGIRPVVDTEACHDECPCVDICPGFQLDGYAETGPPMIDNDTDHHFGPVLEIWEGYASDPDIRHAASSGGALTALALYALEKDNMNFVLHTAEDETKPGTNKTVTSYNRTDLLKATGSRYAPASPCDRLSVIEASDGPCVFIGKPCDVAAVSMYKRKSERFAKNLGLALTFFCAGTPSTKGTLDLISSLGGKMHDIKSVRYRGQGWPGKFNVSYKDDSPQINTDYQTSWGFVQKYRPIRCHLCPDGLGQLADISCGDAWHEYAKDGNDGLSIILIRTQRGKEIFERAVKSGSLKVRLINIDKVFKSQINLLERRRFIFGRIIAFKSLFIPTPKLKKFHLFRNWLRSSTQQELKSYLGTIKRILIRKYWLRKYYERN